MSDIKPYFVKEKGAEWSVLSFNYNRHDAKVNASKQWLTEFEYTDLRVRRADEEYMAFCEKDEPHVVDSWGHDIYFEQYDYPTWKDAIEKKLEQINPNTNE